MAAPPVVASLDQQAMPASRPSGTAFHPPSPVGPAALYVGTLNRLHQTVTFRAGDRRRRRPPPMHVRCCPPFDGRDQAETMPLARPSEPKGQQRTLDFSTAFRLEVLDHIPHQPDRTFNLEPLVYYFVARFAPKWNRPRREKRALIQPIRCYPERFGGGNAQFCLNSYRRSGHLVLLRCNRGHVTRPVWEGTLRDSTQFRKTEPTEHPTR